MVKHKEPRDACAAIVAESYRLWLQYETRTDDITVIVVQISGLTQVRASVLAFLALYFNLISDHTHYSTEQLIYGWSSSSCLLLLNHQVLMWF